MIEKKLESSGLGMNVDKSKAIKTYGIRERNFPRGGSLNSDYSRNSELSNDFNKVEINFSDKVITGGLIVCGLAALGLMGYLTFKSFKSNYSGKFNNFEKEIKKKAISRTISQDFNYFDYFK
jgi:hypothetical protein